MSSLHPDWQQTEVDEVPITIRPSTPKEPETVSRKPAAIAGILLVIATGTVFFGGIQELTGQIATPSTQTIRITNAGVEPSRIEVRVGTTLTWINEKENEQIITSNTLCNERGFCLRTKLLSPGDGDSFTITQDITAGSYAFSSETDPLVAGVIVVTDTTEVFHDLDTIVAQSLQQDFSSQKEPIAHPLGFDAPPPLNPSGIAVNPYTVGSNDHLPQPTTAPVESDVTDPIAQQTSFRGGHGPLRQPTTGAASWMIFGVSALVLWLWSKTSRTVIVR